MTDSETETGGEEGVETSNPVKYDTSKVIEDPDTGLHRFLQVTEVRHHPKKSIKNLKQKNLRQNRQRKEREHPNPLSRLRPNLRIQTTKRRLLNQRKLRSKSKRALSPHLEN